MLVRLQCLFGSNPCQRQPIANSVLCTLLANAMVFASTCCCSEELPTIEHKHDFSSVFLLSFLTGYGAEMMSIVTKSVTHIVTAQPHLDQVCTDFLMRKRSERTGVCCFNRQTLRDLKKEAPSNVAVVRTVADLEWLIARIQIFVLSSGLVVWY